MDRTFMNFRIFRGSMERTNGKPRPCNAEGIHFSRVRECIPNAPSDIETLIEQYTNACVIGGYWTNKDLDDFMKGVYAPAKPTEQALALPPVEAKYKLGQRPLNVIDQTRKEIEETRKEIEEVRKNLNERLDEANRIKKEHISYRTEDLRIFKNRVYARLESIIEYAGFLAENKAEAVRADESFTLNLGTESGKNLIYNFSYEITWNEFSQERRVKITRPISSICTESNLFEVSRTRNGYFPYNVFLPIAVTGAAAGGLITVLSGHPNWIYPVVSALIIPAITEIIDIFGTLYQKLRNPELSLREAHRRVWCDYSLKVKGVDITDHTNLPDKQVRDDVIAELDKTIEVIREKVRQIPKNVK